MRPIVTLPVVLWLFAPVPSLADNPTLTRMGEELDVIVAKIVADAQN